MRIRYETTVEDFVAFTRFHYDHSPAYRRNRVRFMFLAAMGFVVTAVLLAVVLEGAGVESLHNRVRARRFGV